MKVRELARAGARHFLIVFAPGDEVSEGLKRFALEHEIRSGHFAGLGAFSSATVAFFDLERRTYDPIEVEEQVEVLSISGNIGEHEKAPAVHAHVVLGRRDGSAMGGHLLRAFVQPTLEVMVMAFEGALQRRRDERTGLPLLASSED